jgi:hypothetical protein
MSQLQTPHKQTYSRSPLPKAPRHGAGISWETAAQVVIWSLVLGLTMVPPTVFGQGPAAPAQAAPVSGQLNDQDIGNAVVWLPLSLGEDQEDLLRKVLADSGNRQGCEEILEAKVSDGLELAKRRYIVTCRTGSGESMSLSYTISDIENDFAGYPVPRKSTNPELDAEAARSAAMQALLRQHSQLVSDCEQRLQERLNARIAGPERSLGELIAAQRNEVRARNNTTPTVYINFRLQGLGAGEQSTALCKRSRLGQMQLAIYNEQTTWDSADSP